MSNSIGDLRNSGNQGNNFPWQLKVLQGLQAIANSTSGSLTCDDQVSLCVDGDVVNSSNALPVKLGPDQANVMINPAFQRYTNADSDTSGVAVLSISFASVGTANARVSVDGGMIYQDLAPGETLNLDAGGVMNFYNGNNFFWDTTTNVGSSLIVAYNYL
jgi:hypothetical protein